MQLYRILKLTASFGFLFMTALSAADFRMEVTSICGSGDVITTKTPLTEKHADILRKIINFIYPGQGIQMPDKTGLQFDNGGDALVKDSEMQQLQATTAFKEFAGPEIASTLVDLQKARKSLEDRALKLDPKKDQPYYETLKPQLEAYGKIQEILKKDLMKKFNLEFTDNMVDCD